MGSGHAPTSSGPEYEGDNDARGQLSYVAEALDAAEPIDEQAFDTLPPGELGARLGRPQAGDGVLLDDLARRASPGRRAPTLSFREIAEEMFLSRTTIKSQALSIYRKLGAPSGSQAVARSRELGLLQG